MKRYNDEDELTTYIWNHYRHLMTSAENKAGWAALADQKLSVVNQHMVSLIVKRVGFTEDPEAIALLADGPELFRRRTAQRIVRGRASELFINRCPNCTRIVRTPKARQCIWCGHDWHPAPDG